MQASPLKFILMLLNSNLINWYYANNYSNKSDLTVNISKTFLEEIPVKIGQEHEVFVLIADYLLFLFHYNKIENESAVSNNAMLQFFLNLGNAIVYELYFKRILKTDLVGLLKNDLTPIDFNEFHNVKITGSDVYDLYGEII